MTYQRPSFTHLLAAAAEARGEEWADDLAGGIAAASSTPKDWPWPKTWNTASAMITDPKAEGRDLLRDVKATTSSNGATEEPSDETREALANARAAMERASQEFRAGIAAARAAEIDTTPRVNGTAA